MAGSDTPNDNKIDHELIRSPLIKKRPVLKSECISGIRQHVFRISGVSEAEELERKPERHQVRRSKVK